MIIGHTNDARFISFVGVFYQIASWETLAGYLGCVVIF